MEGNQTESNLHPLLLPPVITRLYQYVPLDDQSSFRLVCKQWFNDSLATWRSQNTLRFTKWSLWFANLDESQGETDLLEFLHFWEDNHGSSRPYRRISCEKCTTPVLPGLFDMGGFWECIGQHLTHMTLLECDFQDVNEAHRILYRDCPNLQSLTLVRCKILNGNFQEGNYNFRYRYQDESYIPPKFGEHKNLKSLSLFDCLPDSWLGILSHFSSVEHLCLERYSVRAHFHRKMLEAVKMIREEKGQDRLQIKYLGVPFTLMSDPESMLVIDLLRELHLPVDSLDIILKRDMDRNLVENLLTNHCQTSSRIDSSNDGFQGCVSFPPGMELGNLQQLQVCPGLFQNLEFLKHTPNLRYFQVWDSGGFREQMARGIPQEPCYLFSNLPALNMDTWQLDALTKLVLDCVVSPEQLQNFAKWTPNVNELAMYLDDGKLAIVCGNWKKLVKLEDYGTKITDRGITGVDENGAIYPNVTELKHLVSFITRSVQVGEAAVFDGLLHMPRLREVKLGSTLEAIGEEADAALRNKGIQVRYDAFNFRQRGRFF